MKDRAETPWKQRSLTLQTCFSIFFFPMAMPHRVVGDFLMLQTPHIGRHFTASHVVRDVVIRMSDGPAATVAFVIARAIR